MSPGTSGGAGPSVRRAMASTGGRQDMPLAHVWEKIGDDPGLEREREEEEHGPAWEEINGLGPTRTVSFLIYSK
jgi:hypothetical protein